MSQFRQLKNRFVLFHPNKDDVAEAFRRSQSLGIPPNSFTRGVGRMTGFLGEVAFEKYIKGAEHVGEQCYTHDYLFKGNKVDVKSKTCTTRPQLHYIASVNSENKKLKAVLKDSKLPIEKMCPCMDKLNPSDAMMIEYVHKWVANKEGNFLEKVEKINQEIIQREQISVMTKSKQSRLL